MTVDIEAAPTDPSPPAEAELPAAAGSLPLVLAPAKAATAAVPVPAAKVPPRKQDDPVAAIAPVAALRKPYDELITKVLDMLQDGDPSLARSISSSREAIWEILADRERFRLMN